MKKTITPKEIIPVIEVDSLDLNLLKPEWDYIVDYVTEKRGRVTFALYHEDGFQLGVYRTDSEYWNVEETEFVDVE